MNSKNKHSLPSAVLRQVITPESHLVKSSVPRIQPTHQAVNPDQKPYGTESKLPLLLDHQQEWGIINVLSPAPELQHHQTLSLD
jgi:hypothetical protein